MTEQEIYSNIAAIRQGIEAACSKSGGSVADVKIVAVSKKQSLEKMKIYQKYCRENNLNVIFGESYVQEYRDKKSSLIQPYQSHLIGTLQSNKAKDAVFYFDVIESVHSLKLAGVIDKEAKKINKIQNIFLQINISEDPAKHGFASEEARKFITEILPEFKNLKLCGLMTITKDYDTAEESRPDYKKLRIFRDNLVVNIPLFKNGLALSMGMSHDYMVAVEEGAEFVRIGTALFGEREQ